MPANMMFATSFLTSFFDVLFIFLLSFHFTVCFPFPNSSFPIILRSE
jgi:hypothetical protein